MLVNLFKDKNKLLNIILLITTFISINAYLLTIFDLTKNISYGKLSSYSLGLIPFFPISFWIGILAVLIEIYILIFKKWSSLFAMLVILIFCLYVFGTSELIEKYPRFWDTYWPAGETRIVINTGHMSILSGRPVNSYHLWPVYHLLVTAIYEVLGVSLLSIIRTLYIFTTFVIPLVIFTFLRNYLKNKNYAFSVSIIFISTIWSFFNFYPATLSIIYYVFLLLLLWNMLIHKNTGSLNRKENIVIILFYITLLFEHSRTPIVGILLPTMFLYFVLDHDQKIYIRNMLLTLALATLIFYVFIAIGLLIKGLNEIIQQVIHPTSAQVQLIVKNVIVSESIFKRKIAIGLRLFHVIYLFFFAIFYSFLNIYKKGRYFIENNVLLKSVFVWVVSLTFISFLGYKMPILSYSKIWLLVSLPIALLSILLAKSSIKDMHILKIILLLVILPNLVFAPLSRYVDEHVVFIPNQEQEGAVFFSNYIKIYPTEFKSIASTFRNLNYIGFHKPELYGGIIGNVIEHFSEEIWSKDFNILRKADIILVSKHAEIGITWSGHDYILERYTFRNIDRINLVYINDLYKIYVQK